MSAVLTVGTGAGIVASSYTKFTEFILKLPAVFTILIPCEPEVLKTPAASTFVQVDQLPVDGMVAVASISVPAAFCICTVAGEPLPLATRNETE